MSMLCALVTERLLQSALSSGYRQGDWGYILLSATNIASLFAFGFVTFDVGMRENG
jgi:hypothetical protein